MTTISLASFNSYTTEEFHTVTVCFVAINLLQCKIFEPFPIFDIMFFLL